MRKDDIGIAAFDPTMPIVLQRLPNGGWTVTQPHLSASHEGQRLGAYSNARDMMSALHDALIWNEVQP